MEHKFLRKDKLEHLFASIILNFFIFFLLKNIYLSISITFLIGFLKELIWDATFYKGTPEWGDLLFDAMGIILSSIAIILFMV